MNMRIISTEEVKEMSFVSGVGMHTHSGTHFRHTSLASLGCVFYQNQCQSVQENTIHVTGSGFSRIYYRQWGSSSVLMVVLH